MIIYRLTLFFETQDNSLKVKIIQKSYLLNSNSCLSRIARAAREGGADGVTAINTVSGNNTVISSQTFIGNIFYFCSDHFVP